LALHSTTLPDGKVKWEREPLTLEDILHPQVEDFRAHSVEHQRFSIYLRNVLTARLANNPNTIVFREMRVAWAHPDLKPHGPDIAVIFNVRERRNWETFDEVQEGTKPSLIIEVTDPETRSVDLEDKVKEYALAGVLWYVIVDAYEEKGVTKRRLLGYQLTPDGYALFAPNEQGWLWLEPVGLWLGLRGENIACYDKTVNLIEDYVGVTAARAEAEARVAEEAQARALAEERAHQLESELRRLRGEERE